YGEVLEKDPENEHALNNYTYYLALRGEKLKLAEKQAQKLTTLHPDNPIYWDTYAWVLDKQGDYREAKKLIEKALKSPHGNQGSILEHYGDVLFRLGQKEEAVIQWRKAKDAGEVSELIDKKIAEKKLYEQ
ncbi:MAG: tetratricopeptide repeat protein, partial [Thermonemataceae bacterium]